MNKSLPKQPQTIGKTGKMKLPPDGKVFSFVVEDEITHPQSDMNGEKVFYLQKLLFEDGRNEFRLCYYIIGKKPKMKGKWVFGQFATMMPAEDFKAIINKAREREWI